MISADILCSRKETKKKQHSKMTLKTRACAYTHQAFHPKSSIAHKSVILAARSMRPGKPAPWCV